ncbi:MAG TPA: PIN domain nuclease [Iamia sp.]|nr:PIN domain nuclease [Iamia sp.]
MIVDTSVWIEYIQQTGSRANLVLRQAISDQESITVPEVVRMELLIGPTDEEKAKERRRFLDAFDVVALEPLIDAEEAAAIHRRCRRAGETPRNLLDCMIAAVAIRRDEPVLHRDRDFDVIARHTTLQVVSALGERV